MKQIALLMFALIGEFARAGGSSEGVALPSATNAVQMRLYTNAAPDAAHLFNTIEIEAFGERLLSAPAAKAPLPNLLINGAGPNLAATNGMTLIERASGPEWSYAAFDVTAAYHGRVEQFKRGILFVEPDLFVLYDHLRAKQPVNFQMLLYPPAATTLDTNWGDLHLELPGAGMQIHAPGTKKSRRPWARSAGETSHAPESVLAMQLGPAGAVTNLDLITVFGVYPGGQNPNYAFKLLESDSAVGARISRHGLPTVLAFKTDASATNARLTGFAFQGPVAVGVFKPKAKPAAR